MNSHTKLILIAGMSLLFLSPVWAQQTLLFTQATTVGNVGPGSTFQVFVNVTNVGSVPAINARGDLRNVPPSWVVTPANNGYGPTNGAYNFGTLLPNQTANVVYTVTRDAAIPGPIIPNAGGMWYRVFANNASVAESNPIEVPIHPIVSVLLAGTILGSAFLISRRK